MKIAFIGNMNNLLAITAQYMSDSGHDVTLFLMDDYEHFHPKYAINEVSYKVVETFWEKEAISTLSKQDILDILGGFDFYFAISYGPAFLYKAGLRTHIFAPAGTDITEYPFYKPGTWFPKDWQFDKMEIARLQFLGICNANYACVNPNPENEEFIKVLNIFEKHTTYIPALPYIYYSKKENKPKIDDSILEIRKNSDLLLFQQGRQNWVNKNAGVHSKGNDILLRGMHKFMEKHPGVKVNCILLAYGKDVEASKTLSIELGIENNIFWLPLMAKTQLLDILSICDAGVGILSQNFYAYFSAVEIISKKIPLIHNAENSISDIYPSLHSDNLDNFAEALEQIHYHKESGYLMAEKANEWVLDNLVKIPLDIVHNTFEKRIKSEKLNRAFSYHLLMMYKMILLPINRIVYKIKSTIKR